MRVLGRLAALAIGSLFAIPVGCVVFVTAVLFDPVARDLVASLGLAAMDMIFTEAFDDGAPEIVAQGLVMGLWTFGTTVVALPPLVAAISGEVVGTRSWLWYAGVAALLTAAMPWLMRAGLGTLTAAGPEGRLTAILFLTGAASGFTYWLVAGNSAGRERVSMVG